MTKKPKWEKTILEGAPYYRLEVMKGFHIDVEPYDDRYIIWLGLQDAANLGDALQIAEDFAKVILKHADKIFH